LSLANLSVGDAGPVELIDAAATGGFDSVNMWLVEPVAMAHVTSFRRDVTPVVGNGSLIEAIRRRCDQRGVTIFTASPGWLGPKFDRGSIAAVMETLAALGARSMSLVGWDPERTRLSENFIAVCEAAAAIRLDVHLEFMTYAGLKTVEEARDFVARAAQPNARIIVDALHLDRSGGTPDAVRTLDPATIASLQLCDAPKARPPAEKLRDESVNGRRLPGDGELPLFALLDALPAGVTIELETPDASLVGSSIEARAKRCGDAARRFLDAYGAARPSR
jgi:sugar phosphate isomerase/epimerase